jgi:hypothetical protein
MISFANTTTLKSSIFTNAKVLVGVVRGNAMCNPHVCRDLLVRAEIENTGDIPPESKITAIGLASFNDLHK